ncbi:MAG: hypothetical protein ACRDY2_10315, partial [Acidimicrobiales bacterium]
MAFLSADGWLRALRLGADEVPQLLVLEGTWWAASKRAERLGRLERVRELGLPGIHHGWYGEVAVAFCFVYGAARAVEPVHIFGEIGSTPAVVLIGSCGGIASQVHTGDVVVPEQVPMNFLERPSVARDQIVLPAEVLGTIERQVLGVGRHSGRLLASGQHLKRGVLLHGAPGTGKTHTVGYLLGQLPEATVIVISGRALDRIREACSVARSLPPAV